MKAYKLEILVLDFDELGGDEIRNVIESARYPNDCIAPSVIEVTEADIGQWDDSHPLNHRSTVAAEYKRLFGSESTMSRDLLDDDGENRAVRSFLMQYGVPGLTVAAMGQHMNRSGWPSEYWPDFARQVDNACQHLTKAGAQIWIRHLFSLENAA